jgi:DNA polymerase III delta subunit
MADLQFLRVHEAFRLFSSAKAHAYFILAGSDPVARLDLRRLLIRRHFKAESADEASAGDGRPIMLDAASDPPERVMDSLIELSLFAERRAIVIRNAEKALDARRFPHLPDRLDELDGATLAILECEGSAKELLAAPIVKKAVERKAAAYCYAPNDEPDTLRWIQALGERRGFKIAPAAARRIIEMVGLEPAELASEIEKVAFATGGAVTEAAVTDLLQPHRDRRVFEWADAILAGDRRAVTMTARATDGGKEGVAAAAVLAKRFAEIEIFRAGGFLNFFQKKFISGVEKRWPAGRLARARETLLELDLALKSCREETRLARIELMAFRLIEAR